jgi:hypothetical protein
MSKSASTHDSQAVLLVDAPEEEVVHLHKDLPDWLWLGAPEEWPSDANPKPTDQSIDAVIVFARKEKEKRALDVFSRLCDKKEMENIPLFIAASRYQMNLAHEVKRRPRGDFLFTPINPNTLLKKIREKEGAKS